jgi:hypothetical protein
VISWERRWRLRMKEEISHGGHGGHGGLKGFEDDVWNECSAAFPQSFTFDSRRRRRSTWHVAGNGIRFALNPQKTSVSSVASVRDIFSLVFSPWSEGTQLLQHDRLIPCNLRFIIALFCPRFADGMHHAERQKNIVPNLSVCGCDQIFSL